MPLHAPVQEQRAASSANVLKIERGMAYVRAFVEHVAGQKGVIGPFRQHHLWHGAEHARALARHHHEARDACDGAGKAADVLVAFPGEIASS